MRYENINGLFVNSFM